MSPLVIDASAILAMIFDEAGGDMVADVCEGALMNAVNLDEVLHKVARRRMDPVVVETQLSRLGISVIAFDARQARVSAALHAKLAGTDTSFADRACLSMGLMFDATVLTADATWARLGLDIDIRLIR